MIEYRIEKPAKISTVKYLWKKFLKNDPMWHFTMEGTYIEIRVSKIMPKLDTFLKRKKWKYTKFKYLDNIPITRKYQKQFEYIFHGYSELSMLVPRKKNIDWETEYNEVRQLVERCLHLVHNIFGFSYGGEAKNTIYLGMERAYMAGKVGSGLLTFYEENKRKKVNKLANKDKGRKEIKKKKRNK